MNSIKLRLFSDEDICLMERWLQKEHVKKWYENPDDWLIEIKSRQAEFKFIKHFIALHNDVPIGFCQYYKCADANEDWYGDIPLSGTYSIDYLIGEEMSLGKGFGKRIIALLIKEIFSLTDSERIIVQPDDDNKASCNSLLANGFIFNNDNSLYLKSK
ncbi:MAG: GNAT family N-acetyltransferase [Clostridia bacterium]|nr:GNAT family N-acetyltransferase [Clostridia bacterium]